MYEYEFRMPYSYCKNSGEMDMSTITTIFQDLAAGDHFGYDLKRQRKLGIFWVILSWRVHVNRYPEFDEKVTVRTYLNVMERFIEQRTYSILDENGEPLVVGSSNSIFCNVGSNHPMRFTPEFLAEHTFENFKACEFMPLSNRIKGDFNECGNFIVQRFDVDTNHHMNNISYIRNALDFLDDGFKPKYMQVYYENPTFLGDEISVQKGELDGKTVLKMLNDGQLSATLEFKD